MGKLVAFVTLGILFYALKNIILKRGLHTRLLESCLAQRRLRIPVGGTFSLWC